MKKIISVILVVAMCISAVPAVFAARDVSYQETLAEDLKALGLFQGVSENNFDLNRAPTRTEALVMLIRLLGKDAEAKTGTFSHPFTDVPGWADGYVGYAYNAGLTNGISDTEFGTGNANIQMYLTFVLRALGYSDKASPADFSYDEPYSLSYHTGILPDSVDRENFLRADVVTISYAALSAFMKNTDTTLAKKLIADKVFTSAAFSQNYDSNALKNYGGPVYTELSAEQIYAKCSPAVFYVENYDSNGNLFCTGSGFFIDNNGTAVTNYHVIEGAHSAKIKFGDTEEFYDILGVYDCNAEMDWAVIKVAGYGFNYLELGDVSTVVGGAPVYAIGSPLGLQNTISQGIISNANRIVDGISFIQTSAAISSGSSGGALINKHGQVIGITSAKFSDGENLGLALPMSVIENYSSYNVTPLSEMFGGGSGEEMIDTNAAEVLAAYVEVFQNEQISDSIAYTERMDTENGYLEASVAVDQNGLLEVIVWEVYEDDTYYFSIDLIGNTRLLYYNYESADGSWFLEGTNWMDPTHIARGTEVHFGEAEGPADLALNESFATEYLEIALGYVDGVFEYAANADGIPLYTVRDLGFVNFY